MYNVLHAPSNNSAAAKLLVEGGADVNARNDLGSSPLSVAATCGYMDMVRLLLEQPEIDLDLQVHIACSFKKTE